MPPLACSTYAEPSTPARHPRKTPTTDQEATVPLERSLNPLNHIGYSEEPFTPPRRPLAPSLEDKEFFPPFIRTRIQSPLSSIEEDHEEDHYQDSTSIFTCGSDSTLKELSITSTPTSPPSPNPVQTLLQHLEQVGPAAGVQDSGNSVAKEASPSLLLSLSHTRRVLNRKSIGYVAVPESPLVRDLLSEIGKEIQATQKDLMTSIYREPCTSPPRGINPLQRDEILSGKNSDTVERNDNEYLHGGGRGDDDKVKRSDTDLAAHQAGKAGDRDSWADVIEDLNEFLNAHQIDETKWNAGESSRQNNGNARPESATTEVTAKGKEKSPTTPHMRGGAGDRQEFSAHIKGSSGAGLDIEPHMRGGGPNQPGFVPRKGSHRVPAFISQKYREPEQQNERSLSPSVKSSARTSLNESLANAARGQRHYGDGEESASSSLGGSVKDSRPGSHLSIDSDTSKDSYESNRFGYRDSILKEFPTPPQGVPPSPLKVPPSPMWTSESETEIATPTPLGRRSSLLGGGRMDLLAPSEADDWEDDLMAKAKARPPPLNIGRRTDERAENRKASANFNPPSTIQSKRSNTIGRGDVGLAISEGVPTSSPLSALADQPTLRGITDGFLNDDLYNDSPPSTPQWPLQPVTRVGPAGPYAKRPYPPSISSLENQDDYNHEPRLDNPKIVVSISRPARPNPPWSPFKGKRTGDPNASLSSRDPESGYGRHLPVALSPGRPDRTNILGGIDSSSPTTPGTGMVRRKGFDSQMNTTALHSSPLKLDSPWMSPVREHGAGQQNTAGQGSFDDRKHVSPSTSDFAPLSPVSAGSAPSLWGKKGYKIYKEKEQIRTKGEILPLSSTQAYAYSNLHEDGQSRNVQTFEQVDAWRNNASAVGSLTAPPTSDIFKSVSEKGGFQGQLADEGRALPTVREHAETGQERVRKAAMKRPKTPEFTPEQRQDILRDYKMRQEKMYQELRQGKLRNDRSDTNAEFEADWRMRAQGQGIAVSRSIPPLELID
jgi:hypothetical protein